jgi:hypothetical protein
MVEGAEQDVFESVIDIYPRDRVILETRKKKKKQEKKCCF